MQLEKYNIPVPRYTSYPTVPMWNQDQFSVDGYKQTLQTSFWENSKEVSIYVHLPFCESLCTYCACNTRITRNHSVEEPYLRRVLKEWQLYLQEFPTRPVIREIHLGGGTPTFFAPENLQMLILGLFEGAEKSPNIQMSFEGHPANTKATHLQALYDVGFDRLSLGIQDFDANVQKLINRKQTYEQVKEVMEAAREIGYTSINHDVIYGLPGQTLATLNRTLDQVVGLSPDRIAYYSYAHVPKVKPTQKVYEAFLPSPEEKFEFKQFGKKRLVTEGYQEVGMDHFVKPTDELIKAQERGDLNRNFMGYTTDSSGLLIGLGVSAISDTWTGFIQNEKVVENYSQMIDQGQLPVVRGHLLTKEDLFFRKHILNLMCHFTTRWSITEIMHHGISINFELLYQLEEDGVIALEETGIRVLPDGREMIRIVCSALDARLNETNRSVLFSQAV
ncbi:MAG: oxygen-independent coproporphyrinogen III oxidase [Bacteroidota bacterium]